MPAAVLAAPGSCGDGYEESILAGESGDASGTLLSCLLGGTGIDDTSTPRSSGPWCASGYNTWNNPLTIDTKTGEVIVAPGTTGVSVNGTAGSPALTALYYEAPPGLDGGSWGRRDQLVVLQDHWSGRVDGDEPPNRTSHRRWRCGWRPHDTVALPQHERIRRLPEPVLAQDACWHGAGYEHDHYG